MTTTAPTTTAPGATAPSTTTDDKTQGKSALEVLAIAGDENARRELGLPTAAATGAALTKSAASKGFRVGEAAPRDVFVDEAGKVVSDPSKSKDGFRGTQVAVKGTAVSAATITALQAAGEL